MGAAKLLRKIMIDKKVKQYDLAEQMNKPKQTVYNTMCRDRMTWDNVVQYADALGCDVVIIDRETKKVYD